jgi:hypothetical protein
VNSTNTLKISCREKNLILCLSWPHRGPRKREDSVWAGKVTGKKRIIGLRSFSISPNKRGLKDGVVNPKAKSLDDAPPEVVKLAEKLTALNDGKPVNYLSFIAYENEQDHIDWHQHNEDRCRDAKVFIVSLGEVRTFGIRRICRSAQKCYPCLRYVVSPMYPGRTQELWSGRWESGAVDKSANLAG